MTERKKQYREELFKLMQENPDLPIVPMVDADIVADDCGYWIGAWGRASVDEYLFAERSEKMLFKSDDDVFGALESYMSYEEFEALPESESECRHYYNKLPWIKAIIVYINLPE